MSQFTLSNKASSSSTSSTLQLLTSFVSGAITMFTVQYVVRKYYYRSKVIIQDDRTNGTSTKYELQKEKSVNILIGLF